MKPITGTYKDKTEIEKVCLAHIQFNTDAFAKVLFAFSANPLFHQWRLMIRSIEEMINIPLEINNIPFFSSLRFNFVNDPDDKNKAHLAKLSNELTAIFDKEVATRFRLLSLMCNTSNEIYNQGKIWDFIGSGLNLSSVEQASRYLQSRRQQFGMVLKLIPGMANGPATALQQDLFNHFLYAIDTCLVGIITSYHNLLINECIDSYEVTFDGKMFKPNMNFEYLENFFLEPERLSLIDQMELRPDIVHPAKTIPLPPSTIFSFNEIANAMALFETAFQKYKVTQLNEYAELNTLFMGVARFCKDNYNVIVDKDDLDIIQAKLKNLKLYVSNPTYLDIINDYTPFQEFEGKYYSTVVLLTRFAYRTLTGALMGNHSFQINSGFIFEDRVSLILEKYGYQPTGITRINRKEFDLITIKNGKVYNFQCKNNYIDIARIGGDYKLMGRLNKRLIEYYRKSIIKEEKRENLIATKTGIKNVSHFVVSRYPVITLDIDIINLNVLEKWLKKQNH
jgi:hypothetical protein